MQTQIQDLTIRHPQNEDTDSVLALMQRSDIAEYGESDSDIEDLLFDWQLLDRQQDAWLVFDPTNKLIGYAAVIPRRADLQFDCYATPDWEDARLGQMLLALCAERGNTIAAIRGEPVQVHMYIAHVNAQAIQTAENAGFQLGSYFFQMQMNLTAPLTEPVWPEGVGVQTAVANQDDLEIYTLIQTAFAKPGRTPPAFEEWKSYMIDTALYDPDIWFLASVENKIIGASLCVPYDTMGWVRQLGVTPEWQGKGIGAALLRHTFQAFKQRGYTTVGLGVDSDRAGANHFYHQIGMQTARQYDEYVKAIG